MCRTSYEPTVVVSSPPYIDDTLIQFLIIRMMTELVDNYRNLKLDELFMKMWLWWETLLGLLNLESNLVSECNLESLLTFSPLQWNSRSCFLSLRKRNKWTMLVKFASECSCQLNNYSVMTTLPAHVRDCSRIPTRRL